MTSTNLDTTYLITGSYIIYDTDEYQVSGIDSNGIILTTKNFGDLTIDDKALKPILMSNEWLNRFNIKEGQAIRNAETNVDWTIKSTHNKFYLTIKDGYGENPVIPLNEVHMLQWWFHKLTRTHLL